MEGSDANADALGFFDELLSVYGDDDDVTDPSEMAADAYADDGDVERELDGDDDVDLEYDETGETDADELEDEVADELVDLDDEFEDEDAETEFDDEQVEPEFDDEDVFEDEVAEVDGELGLVDEFAEDEAEEVDEDPSSADDDELDKGLDERHEDAFEAELMQSLRKEEPALESSSLADHGRKSPDAEALTKEVWPVEPTWLEEPSPLIEEALAVQSGVRTLRSEPVSKAAAKIEHPPVKRAPREINASLIIGGLLVIVAVVLGVLLVLG